MAEALASRQTGSPATRRPPRIGPALVVVAVAVGLLVVFGIGSALNHGSGRAPAHPSLRRAASLQAAPARRALAPIERPGTPPADVLGSLVVPASARALGHQAWNGLTQFSATMTFSLGASQATLVSFYRQELRGRGWSIVSVGAAHNRPGASEVLAQRASADGWYWEVGVVVAPTTFGSRSASDTTRFTVSLFEETDAA